MKYFLHRSYISVILTLFFSALGLSLSAQNLVLNPSFEITSACPQGISQFDLATNWAQGNSGSDSCTTSDLYAGCTPQFGGSNSPNGLLGYQGSRTGTHHAGIILGEGFLGCTLIGDNYREYIEGHTSSPLVAGQKYLVRFYVSLPEGIMGGTDDIGLYFSNTYYSHNACTSGQLMTVTPQLNYCGPAIMDTINWVEMRWIYTAVGGESYFTIGNFKNDGNTSVTPLNCTGFNQNPYLYYYIDDVEISTASANDCGFALVTTTRNAGCANNDGTATVTATGCTSPFHYSWSTTAQTNTIANLPSGSYTVTVSDGASCSSTIAAVVGAYTPPSIQINTINAGCTTNNGTAIANVITGTGPYTYHWNNNASTQVINNLGAGAYQVTITGAGSCSASASATITASNGSLTLTGSSTPASCGNSNGTATVAVSGGPGPFNYSWSNTQTTATIANLAQGNYTVTVSPNTTVTNTPFFTEDFTSGSAAWTFADGPGTNGAQPNQWVVNNNADCLCGTGNYLHITCNAASFFCLGNTGGCTYFTGVPIPNPFFGDPTADKLAISPVISTVGKSNIILKFKYMVGGDPGLDYGQIRFSADGGNSWTDMPAQYSDSVVCTSASVSVPSNYENISNFKFAFRWVNNQDANGNDPGFAIDDVQLIENSAGSCPSITTVQVSSSGSLTLNTSSTDANCGQNNGTASVAVANPGNYTYHWNNNATTSALSNLAGGTYSVTVSESVSCSATTSVTIVATAGLSLTTTANNATCGNNNGSATAAVSGTGNYTYVWSNTATTATISNLQPGVYTVSVNESSCSATSSAAVASTAGLTGVFSVNQPSCGQTNGSLNCTNLVGATQPIDFEWRLNNVVISTGAQVSNLGSGTYTFHASDAVGCSLDSSFIFNSIGPNGVTINVNPAIMCAGDSLLICAPAGYSSYLWNNSETAMCIYSKLAGNYYVTVTDAGNCTATSNHLAISVYPTPPVSISVNGDTLTAYGAVSYQWYRNATSIPNATDSVYVAVSPGDYTVAITDINGCSATSTQVTVTKTGFAELLFGHIKIYPNPLESGMWNLETGSDLLGNTFEIFDTEGRLVLRSEIREMKSEISLTVASGIYLLRINSDKASITRKLIKL